MQSDECNHCRCRFAPGHGHLLLVSKPTGRARQAQILEEVPQHEHGGRAQRRVRFLRRSAPADIQTAAIAAAVQQQHHPATARVQRIAHGGLNFPQTVSVRPVSALYHGSQFCRRTFRLRI